MEPHSNSGIDRKTSRFHGRFFTPHLKKKDGTDASGPDGETWDSSWLFLFCRGNNQQEF
jgi:hypothetical protein